MKFLLILLFSLTVISPNISAQDTPTPTPSSPLKTFEFKDALLVDVFKDLAKQAGIALIISDKVEGSVAIRLEDKTAFETLRIIAAAKSLYLDEIEGIWCIRTAAERDRFMHLLDYPGLPQTLAVFKKRYYDALVKEGFSKEEALKIVTSDALPLDKLKVIGH